MDFAIIFDLFCPQFFSTMLTGHNFNCSLEGIHNSTGCLKQLTVKTVNFEMIN